MSGPLDGIRVVDLTAVGMGPYATQILGDMGADVIKIESPDGDLFRHAAPSRHAGMGATYLNLNRNKRSIVLDLKQAAQLDILRRLIVKADVLVSSVRPQAMRKLGLEYEALSKVHPRLIYCGVYGFSEAGPYAGRPAFDDIIQAMSGLAALQGHNDPEGPRYVNTIAADKTAGLTAAWAIAMALYERERSGCGQAVEVPMFETMVSFNWIEHLGGETFVPAEGEMGYGRVLSEHRRPYRTKDGYIGLMPYTNLHWQRFFALAGQPELAGDARFTDPASRSRNVGELYRILAEMVAGKTTAEWEALLSGSDIPMTRVFSGEDLLRDPHLLEVGMFQEVVHPTEGKIRMLGIPVRFSRTPGSVRLAAPVLDADRESVLRELEGPEGAK
jgi:crotonobetainyl-CoA:carnitine CoA-transferase CaiB-like acyl-CoA transferase